YKNQTLKGFIAWLSDASSTYGVNTGSLARSLRELADRIVHDEVAVPRFKASGAHPGLPVACDAIADYAAELQNRQVFDFSTLEARFLAALRAGDMQPYLQSLRFVLVDEYQDTNLLQEEIYFELG